VFFNFSGGVVFMISDDFIFSFLFPEISAMPAGAVRIRFADAAGAGAVPLPA
jgi:hypothetical protein